VGTQIRFARTVGKISDEQTDCQGSLVKGTLILSQEGDRTRGGPSGPPPSRTQNPGMKLNCHTQPC
jgi:hypothetical protein